MRQPGTPGKLKSENPALVFERGIPPRFVYWIQQERFGRKAVCEREERMVKKLGCLALAGAMVVGSMGMNVSSAKADDYTQITYAFVTFNNVPDDTSKVEEAGQPGRAERRD